MIRCFLVVQREAHPQTCVGPFYPHSVILHRDEVHQDQLDDVVNALTTVVGVLSHEEARRIAVHAFSIGQEMVIACPKETAEHYQERLTVYGLTVSVKVR
ncbi:hypothetical protein KSF_107070 [Reticulibacter mediterranei]|uniref:Adaptor protein ClpS core domain-containing protein n=1 Tax=Reticulibacter mediterranei TaxID=2778369 RepID=A0A8J3N6Z6_9CHLR|nr:ATP-dependent Clp protease adaptor ClpS [Reticulibacter mediterranei]GHP00660.1 hypothetical protein KSF_107070 [Reticulibacter mediterranei]